MITRLICVRHGQAEGNVLNEFHGHYDSPLTELGHSQAERTAVWLDSYPIEAVYSSDLRRAVQTAKHIAARLGLTVVPVVGLREIAAGKWEKMKFADIARDYPAEFSLWQKTSGDFRCPGGESLADVYDRVTRAFGEIARKNAGRTVAVVSHATPLRMLKYLWDGTPLDAAADDTWVSNASVSIAEYDLDTGLYSVPLYGEAGQLGELNIRPNFNDFKKGNTVK